MGTLKTVLIVIEAICSIALIVVVLLQSGKEAGLSSALTGASETYLSKNKQGNLDAKLASLTKWIALVLVLLTLALSLAACGKKNAASDLASVQAKGKLVVGITEFAPMDYKNADGTWVGFDADLAKAFAESIGVTAEFIVLDWDSKIMELDSKNVEVLWNGMTLTDEVKNSMECTNPYFNNAQVVVTAGK